MTRKKKEAFVFGEFLRELRERKGVTLKQVEEGTGLSNAYISQLETGARRRLPGPEKLKAIADYFNVSVGELISKAGYTGAFDVGETLEQKIEKAFTHAISDPLFHSGGRIDAESLTLDAKRFINELYEKSVRNRSRPLPTAYFFDDGHKTLQWTIEDVKRSVVRKGKYQQYLKYKVTVVCFESEEETPTQSVNATAEVTVPFHFPYGHEARLLEETTRAALDKAIAKIKGTDWKEILHND